MKRFRLLSALAGVAALAPIAASAQTPSFAPPALQRPTFVAAAAGLAVPQTAAGDAVCIYGSATKLIRVKRIAISGIDTTAQIATVALVKRSAANSGGTSTAPTAVPLDSSNVAATATLAAYTAVPTSGTAVGTLRAQSLPLPAATGTTQGPIVWEFGASNTQDLVLRGAAQGACVNFPNALTTNGATVNVDVTWTEQ